MINIGTRINGYIIIAAANGYVLAANSAAPSRFVVWTVDDDGHGVHTGRYFNDRMDAEWEFCGLAFEWFQDNVLISYEEDAEFEARAENAHVSALEESLSAAHRSLAAAIDLVEELFAEHERLCPKEDRVTDEPIDKVAREFAEDFENMVNASSLDSFTASVSILNDLKKRQSQRRKMLYDILKTL